MMSRAIAVRTGVALVVVVLVGSCSSSSPDKAEATLPTGVPVVSVTMSDYRFAYNQKIPSGRVVFRARNVGRVNHEVRLYPLTEDFPPIGEQLQGSQRRILNRFARMTPRRPGGGGTFAVNLAPGQRYALICFVLDPDRQTHAVKGMSSEFRTPGEPPAEPAAPGAPEPPPAPAPPGTEEPPS